LLLQSRLVELEGVDPVPRHVLKLLIPDLIKQLSFLPVRAGTSRSFHSVENLP
jgi:hypothetical protein